MQTGLKAMDGTCSTACFLSQRGSAKQGHPSPKSCASSAALCPFLNGDQVWLEELTGPSTYRLSPSLPSGYSVPSSSPGSSRSSSKGTSSPNSWSSGVTGLLHNSIKKQSWEAFQTRLRKQRRWPACPARGRHGRTHPQAEQGGGNRHNKLHAWPERGGDCQRRSSVQTQSSDKLEWLLEEKIEAKVKFSQFLDEVTSNVIDPNSLLAFGKPVSPCSFTTTRLAQPEDNLQVVTQWSPRLRSLLEQTTQDKQIHNDPTLRTYLETNIDTVSEDEQPEYLEIETNTPSPLELDERIVIPPPPKFCEGFKMTEFHLDFPRSPYRSASLPRGINMVSDESRPRPPDMCDY